jgi:hypothetical protein
MLLGPIAAALVAIVLLALGITVMYVGFLVTTGARRPAIAPTGAEPDGRRQ